MNSVDEAGLLKRHGHWFVLGVVALAVMALVFSTNGWFDARIDARVYADQIHSFSEGEPFSADPVILLRIFKPFYALIGGTLFHSTFPYLTILLINIFFYLALVVTAFFLFRELNFSRNESTIGAIWVATAYPVLKYGLALGTDISGWTLTALTLLCGLIALRKNSHFLLCIASVIGFLGAISKETGVMGLVALTLLIIWRYRKSGFKMWGSSIVCAVVPAFVLYGVLLGTISNQAPNFLDWFMANRTQYENAGIYSLFNFTAVEVSTFGLYWLGVLCAIIVMLKKRQPFLRLDVVIVGFVATLPILLWPLFISRILFIQFIWVIPLALYGYTILKNSLTNTASVKKGSIIGAVIVIPIAFNVVLFFLGAHGSLFSVFF